MPWYFPDPECYRSSGIWPVLCSGYTQYSEWVTRVMASTVSQGLKRILQGGSMTCRRATRKRPLSSITLHWRKLTSPTLWVRETFNSGSFKEVTLEKLNWVQVVFIGIGESKELSYTVFCEPINTSFLSIGLIWFRTSSQISVTHKSNS